ncbi:odorant receptor 46a-like [Leptopilina boulardi]|uniref:odorant receptor 46a-like n=1 Tax=Leptopilina boulardi TaxID=63433 RepID=UPI0021F57F47|nr:odorant receptor 46a-like [Leptopilina boulardi]
MKLYRDTDYYTNYTGITMLYNYKALPIIYRLLQLNTMDILPLPFRTLSFTGLWNKDSNFSFVKSIYKIFVVTSIFHFTISEAVGFLKICNTEEDSTQGLFLSFTFAALCLKILNFLFQQEKMSDIIQNFRVQSFQPKSPDEKVIWEKYNCEAKRIFLIFLILSQSSGLCFLTLPFMETGFENITLPFKTYQPYNVANSQLYSITYILQLLEAFYGVLINVSLDSMVYGFILLLCAQYEILCLRLMKIDDNNNFLLKTYVDHHVQIKSQICKIQHFFMRVISTLFFFSLITLGASIFKIIELKLLSIECFTMCLYLTCMLFQIFLYCHHGHELTLKSKIVINAIYNSNWTPLNSKNRKSLQLIMQYSAKGVVISHRGQCILNLNTFVWIIKTSYSALNILRKE